jgi:hypothetical protein
MFISGMPLAPPPPSAAAAKPIRPAATPGGFVTLGGGCPETGKNCRDEWRYCRAAIPWFWDGGGE